MNKLPFWSVLVLFLLAGCASEQSEWDRAKKENTVEAYAGFLRSYPDSPHTAEANEGLLEADWSEVSRIATSDALRGFIERHPDSEHTDVAMAEIEERDWKSTPDHEAAEIEKMFSTWPNGKQRQAAESRLARVLWPEIEALDDREMFKAFGQRFSNTPMAGQALERAKDFSIHLTGSGRATSCYSSSKRLAGFVVEIKSQWPNTALKIKSGNVRAKLVDGRTVPLRVVFDLGSSGVTIKRPSPGRICGAGASTSIDGVLPVWGYIGQNSYILSDAEGIFGPGVRFTRGGRVRLGLIFEAAIGAVVELEFFGEYSVKKL